MIVEGWRNPSVLVVQSDEMLWVPDDAGNRHRKQIADIEASGYTIPFWGSRKIYRNIDFANATLSGAGLVASGLTHSVRVTNGGINPYIASIVGPGWGVFGALAQSPPGATFDRSEATLIDHGVNFGDLRHVGVQVYIRYDDPVYPLPNKPHPKWNYLLQCPQGDLPSGVAIAVGVRVSEGVPILDFRRGLTGETIAPRHWSIPLNGEGDENYYNRVFHILVSFKLHATHGFLRTQVYRPWDGETLVSPDYYGPLGFTGGDDKCSVKIGMYRGSQDAQPGQNANPGAYFAFRRAKITNTLQDARTW